MDGAPLGQNTKTLRDVLFRDEKGNHPSEREWVALVKRVAAGDQLALHALYDRSHALVFTLALRITRSREMSEELTVDVFHSVWQRAQAYDPVHGTVLGWIMNLARSRAIDRCRHETRQKRSGDLPLPSETNVADPGEQLAEGQLLRAALETLSESERQAIEEAFFSGLTYVEVAERLNAPLATVKTRIRAGLSKLRRVMGGEGESS